MLFVCPFTKKINSLKRFDQKDKEALRKESKPTASSHGGRLSSVLSSTTPGEADLGTSEKGREPSGETGFPESPLMIEEVTSSSV